MPNEVYWDPYNAGQRWSPYEVWRRLQDEAPVYYNEKFDFYALSRFSDVLAASLDTETFSSAYGITIDSVGRKPDVPMMIMMDPPRHAALRKVVNRAFTPRRVAALEARIRELCGIYLDPHVGGGTFDYVAEFTARLPVMVISSLLGFPEEDHDQLREWSDSVLHREEGVETQTDQAKRNMALAYEYYHRQVDERRARPADDMVSALTEADLTEPDGTVRKLADIEIVGMITLISNAGNETVARMLGWAALVLSEHPDQRAELGTDPALLPGAVEELLRYEAPSPIQGRYVTRDVELHGTHVPEGATMALLTGAAGRDPRQYPNPDHFDIHRNFDRHVSLGYGAHYCLGAALARLEGRIGIEETIRRFPEWTIDRSQMKLVSTNTVRGPSSLPFSG